MANAPVTSEGMDDIEQYQTKTKYNKTRIVYICIEVLIHINYILQIIHKPKEIDIPKIVDIW